jgi:hypothetical protein
MRAICHVSVCVCVLVRACEGDKNEVRGEEQRSREG